MIKNTIMTVLPEQTNRPPLAPSIGNGKTRVRRRNGFSLVEVTLALGLVSYALLGLLGLLTVGLTSSRDSSLETALSQIALHASSSYRETAGSYDLYYTFEGTVTTESDAYFNVKVSRVPNDNVPSNLHLISIAIGRKDNPGVTNVVQTSAYIP
jgi:uncharacterized protein (TIGR02598 family)